MRLATSSPLARLAALPALIGLLALAGCADKGQEAGPDASETTEQLAPEHGGVQVIDGTVSPSYTVDSSAVAASGESGGGTLTVTIIVDSPTGERIAPSASIWYEDDTTLECRLAPDAYPTLEGERLEVQLPCNGQLRVGEPAEITIADDLDR